MKVVDYGVRASRLAQLAVVAMTCTACGSDSDGGFVSPPVTWNWTDLGGPPAVVSPVASNHEPLIVAGGDLLLGTDDGVWRRPLAGTAQWNRAGLEGRRIHALARVSDGGRIIAAGFDPRDDKAAPAWYSTDGGNSWVAAATWPRGEPGSVFAGATFPFYSLELDPYASDVVYGGLDGDTVAVTVDGGATWIMSDGATSPTFGYACVTHRPPSRPVLLQGCELPLDVAWVGARRVIEDDRFTLPDFRYLYGYPELTELGNRRINSIAAPSGRNDRVLVGAEGGLVELTSESGRWVDRSDVTARWVLRSREGNSDFPYAYIRAISILDDSGRQILFGGTVNGFNEELSLFETVNAGADVRQIGAPVPLNDPSVEQALRLAVNDVLLVISQTDPNDPMQESGPRSATVFRLQRP